MSEEKNKIREDALEIAAQCWCEPETRHTEMDVQLAEVFASKLEAKMNSSDYWKHQARTITDYSEKQAERIKELEQQLEKYKRAESLNELTKLGQEMGDYDSVDQSDQYVVSKRGAIRRYQPTTPTSGE